MSKVKKNIIDNFETEIINNNKELEYFEEICPILWIKENSFAVVFKGYGISFHIQNGHYFDTDKLNKYIKVKYKSDIGKNDFKIHPIFE